MRLQAEVSGDQGHSARAEAEPFRMDMRKKRVIALRLFKQHGCLSLLERHQVLIWSHQGIRWSKTVLCSLL